MSTKLKNIIVEILLAMLFPMMMIAFLTVYQDGTQFWNTLGMVSRYLIVIDLMFIEIIGRKKI